MNTPDGINPELKKTLEELKPVPARDPATAARGKARFLAEAASLRATQSGRARPRRFALNAVAAMVAALVLFFGGSVGAVYAAQDALPGESMYSLKLWGEEFRLGLASTPDAKIDLLMQFVQTRVTEMNELTEQGLIPPTETQERTEEQLRTALDLAAGMDDAPMQAALLRIRAQLESQSLSLAEGIPVQVRTLFQAQLQRVDNGLANPASFRNQEQAGQTPSPMPSAQSTPTPQTTTTGNGPGAGGTPTPGGGSSPTNSPHNPQITPGPTQELGGNGNNGQGGKP